MSEFLLLFAYTAGHTTLGKFGIKHSAHGGKIQNPTS